MGTHADPGARARGAANGDRWEFGSDFVLGAATAAFQIEGANHTDGRTDSIWDVFCRVPGAVINSDDGSVACDHYHRYHARPGDVEAARRIDGQMNRIFLDPVFRGAYPDDVLADMAGLGLEEHIQGGDLSVISTPIDVLGVNCYQGALVSDQPADATGGIEAPADRPTRSPFPAADKIYTDPADGPSTGMGWPIQPQGLRELLVRLHSDYAQPAGVALWVTENGGIRRGDRRRLGARSRPDRIPARSSRRGARRGGRRRPGPRLLLLVADGQLRVGLGYAKRFGLVRVDYDTQRRTVKESGRTYARVIADRALEPRA